MVCDRLCHSVLDVRALLAGLRERLTPDGRIYLTAFNYLWEVPARLAEMSGLEAAGADRQLAVRDSTSATCSTSPGWRWCGSRTG